MKHPKIIMAKILMVTLLSLGMAACNLDPDGACESKMLLSSYTSYSCIDETENYCDQPSSSTEKVFHEGKSCASLGYTYANSINPDIKKASDDGKSPGANGAFANSNSSAGGGGGSGVDCSGGYQGPEFDIQIDAQCKTAFAYYCSGAQAGVDAACAIYKTYQDSDPSIPDCPYCK